MKAIYALVSVLILTACAVTSSAVSHAATARSTPANINCRARDAAPFIDWRTSDAADDAELARWCRAVGVPVMVEATLAAPAPPLDDLVVLSWNAHLAEGELPRLVRELTSGELTGRPERHFVIAVQELYRRGDAVPAFDPGDRTAHAIVPRDPESPDVNNFASSLGLSIYYVPSMRNGAALYEDRGNAIVSTEPLRDPIALELPLARQRRVALAATIDVQTATGVRPLQIVDAHLEPLSSPQSLWVLKDPRPAQVRAIRDLLDEPRFTNPANAGVILGGDFNTVRGGAGEAAYRIARAWGTSLGTEDRRATHMMGRLDYLFFRLADGWTASTERIDDRFGSDHHPVLGTFARSSADSAR